MVCIVNGGDNISLSKKEKEKEISDFNRRNYGNLTLCEVKQKIVMGGMSRGPY